MGWKDINLNRHKPQPRFAVIPVAEGQDRTSAVLARACDAAWTAFTGQGAGPADGVSAGYLAGFARHQALKHGVDAEADGGKALLVALAAQAPDIVQALELAPRKLPSSRAALGVSDELADAGYLVGHLESLCGTRRLLAADGDVGAYLTLCDQAADRLQTHHPTDVLRLDPAERAVVRAALVRL